MIGNNYYEKDFLGSISDFYQSNCGLERIDQSYPRYFIGFDESEVM